MPLSLSRHTGPPGTTSSDRTTHIQLLGRIKHIQHLKGTNVGSLKHFYRKRIATASIYKSIETPHCITTVQFKQILLLVVCEPVPYQLTFSTFQCTKVLLVEIYCRVPARRGLQQTTRAATRHGARDPLVGPQVDQTYMGASNLRS